MKREKGWEEVEKKIKIVIFINMITYRDALLCVSVYCLI